MVTAQKVLSMKINAKLPKEMVFAKFARFRTFLGRHTRTRLSQRLANELHVCDVRLFEISYAVGKHISIIVMLVLKKQIIACFIVVIGAYNAARIPEWSINI
jgi:hypothetical protein